MDLKLCWGARARGAQLGRASITSPWLQTPPESCSAFCCTVRLCVCPARAKHLQERAQTSCSPPDPLGLGNISSLSLSILTSDFHTISPGRLESTACCPSWCALHGLTDTALLCASALLPDSKMGLGDLLRQVLNGEPGKRKQHLLLEQLRLFRKGHKLLGTRVLLSTHKQLFLSASTLA